MAFESAKTMLRGQRVPGCFVRFYWNKAVHPRGYLAGGVNLDGHRGLLVEIDYDNNTLRLRGADKDRSDTFAVCGRGAKNFALSKHVAARMKLKTAVRIPLELADDGWYYGTYEQEQ